MTQLRITPLHRPIDNLDRTINEFKALCDRVMPGESVCGMGWGEQLLDADGNLRSDSPVRFRSAEEASS